MFLFKLIVKFFIIPINLNKYFQDGNSTVVSMGKRGHSSHNERFYEEGEYERKVRKRRARLITAAEESFTHIRRLREVSGKIHVFIPIRLPYHISFCFRIRKQKFSWVYTSQIIFRNPVFSPTSEVFLRRKESISNKEVLSNKCKKFQFLY